MNFKNQISKTKSFITEQGIPWTRDKLWPHLMQRSVIYLCGLFILCHIFFDEYSTIKKVMELILTLAILVIFFIKVSKEGEKVEREILENSTQRDLKRIIKETKVTCLTCGQVSYYGEKEINDSRRAENQKTCKDVSCCCLGVLIAPLIPDQQARDLDKCPNCNSALIKKEEIEHVLN